MVDKSLYHDAIKDKMQKYGLPDQKKYPMPDRKHVLSAIKFFNYVDPAHEKQLAKAILNRIREYEMDFEDFGVGDDNRFKKYIPEKYLAHHGIKGQKWGIRRYQNSDGSLTEEGKKRYLKEVDDVFNKKNKNEIEAHQRLNKHIVKTLKSSKELTSIMDEARSLFDEENKEWDKWISDENAVRNTTKEYLKERENISLSDKEVDNYIKDNAGSDFYSDTWEYESSKHPHMRKRSDKIFELSQDYRVKSEQYFNDLLGKYGNQKVPDSKLYMFDSKTTYTKYLTGRSADLFWDLMYGYYNDV